MKLVVPGEEEKKAELSASAPNEGEARLEEKTAKKVTVGERYEVCSVSFELLLVSPRDDSMKSVISPTVIKWTIFFLV